jgi:LysM repeat protein
VRTNALLIGLNLLSAMSFAGATTHIVKSGDNLYRIALNHGVSVSQLQSANPGVNAETLRVGQKLEIPSKGQATAARSASPAAAPVAKAPAKAAPAPRAAATGTYEIKAGDSLSKIAREKGTTIAALQAANPTLNPNRMAIGQKINLSGTGSSAASHSAIAQAPAAPAPAAVAKSPVPAPEPKQEFAAVEAPVTAPPATPAPVMENTTAKTIQNEPAPAEPAATSYRLIKTTRELTLSDVAKEHNTTTDKINALNGWSFSPQTLLAVDSELYVPAQP